MLRPRDMLICGIFFLCTTSLGLGTASAGTTKPRSLQGRFLHITDFHPDPFYKTYSSTEEDAACHRKRGPAGYYGAETSACDSAISLVNATMDWIKDNLAEKIDFVIWTGDSARHDNDEKLPRTQKQIIEQNEFMVQKFTEVFGKGDNDDDDDFTIPIVPTFGNNDIMPHNILLAGPNKWTLRYLDIWRGFIPEAQRHQFQQGGWFHVEVIPGKLAVVSLNTMYFFSSNSGVDGCANKHEPGYEHFEWLRIQLQIMRDRGMNAILIGHVPPARVDSKESWDETCWQKFALWERQYRDVILGSFFGHMNIDHFMLQDFKQIKKKTRKGLMSSAEMNDQEGGVSLLEDGEVTVASASDYLLDLREAWAKLPSPSTESSLSTADYVDGDGDDNNKELSMWQKFLSTFSKSKKGSKSNKPKSGKDKYLKKIGGKYAERYSLTLVSPSVVPNYFPTLRVLEYNISGLENAFVHPVHDTPKSLEFPLRRNSITDNDIFDDATYKQEIEMAVKRKQKKKEKEALKKKKQYKFKVPKGPSKSTPPGPAYSPQSLTLTGYTQYFANLTHINNDFTNNSFNDNSPHAIFGLQVDEDGVIQMGKWKEGKHGKHQGKKPRPKPHPKKFKFQVEYDTKTDKMYKLKDLTVRSYVDLARRIGQDEKKSSAVQEEDEWDDDIFSDEEDVSDDDEEVAEADDDSQIDETKKKHKKGKIKKHKNSAWFTFVKRAFVETMDPRDIEQLFGAGVEENVTEEQEIMEL